MGNRYAFQLEIDDRFPAGQKDSLTTGEELNIRTAPPVSWVVYVSYLQPEDLGFVASMGMDVSVLGLTSGIAGQSFVDFLGDVAVPMCGGCYAANGREISVALRAPVDNGIIYSMQIFGVPNQVLSPDHEVRRITAGNSVRLPPFSVAVSASPPGQTLEVLGVDDATVVQTLALADYDNFAPLHPLGLFIRNAALVTTLAVFKKKNYFG